MPKIRLNSTRGVVQESGGGVALYNTVQEIACTSATVGAHQILAASSLVVAESTGNTDVLTLPATGSLPAGHTIFIVNKDQTHDLEVTPLDQSGGEMINGVAGGQLLLGEKTAATFVYTGAGNPGWFAVVSDTTNLPN